MGPKAQEIVRQFLRRDLQAHLFSPREARAEFVARRYRKGAKVADRFPERLGFSAEGCNLSPSIPLRA